MLLRSGTLLTCTSCQSAPGANGGMCDLQVKSGLISFPLLEPPSGWALLALDLEAVAAAAGGSAFKCLRSVQLCGTVTVRGVLTSDIKFSANVSGMWGCLRSPCCSCGCALRTLALLLSCSQSPCNGAHALQQPAIMTPSTAPGMLCCPAHTAHPSSRHDMSFSCALLC